MRTIFSIAIALFTFTFVLAQRFVLEPFTGGIPSGWIADDSRISVATSSASSGYSSPVPASGGNNIIFSNCLPNMTTMTLTTASYDFTGKTGIRIGFGIRRTNTGVEMSVSYSINGGSPVSIATTSGTSTTWQYLQYNVSALDNQNNVTFLFQITTGGSSGSAACSTGSGNTRIDDFAIGENMSLSAPLPVTFNYFSIDKHKLKTFISFSTASETNNSHFDIERSGDGRNFQSIGKIQGAGDSREERQYSFFDEKPLSGINYYRIKQTDFDGKYSYSEIRSLKFGSSLTFDITPRQTEGRLMLTTEIENYSVEVLNSEGRLMLTLSNLSASQNIDLDAFKPGIYYIHLIHDGVSETKRIIRI